MGNAGKQAVAVLTGPVDRRGFLGRCGALPVAGVAAGGVVTEAAAAVTGARLNIFQGKYAIDGHRIVDGYFASPRGRAKLDVVVVLPEAGAAKGTAEAKARSFAAQGWLAIAPDLSATYRGAALGGRPALVAAMMRDLPRLKRMARSSGRVVVAA